MKRITELLGLLMIVAFTFSSCQNAESSHAKCEHSESAHAKCEHSESAHAKCDSSDCSHATCEHSKSAHAKCDHSECTHAKCKKGGAIDMDNLRVEIQAMEDAFAAAEKAKDADAVASVYYSEDAVSYSRNKQPSVGRAAIRENIAKGFENDTLGEYSVYKVVDLYAEGNTAVEIGSWTNFDADGNEVGYPLNPNGSVSGIAALNNHEGNVMGLMPHPEDHIFPWQHPHYHRGVTGNFGLVLFQNGIRYA